MGGDADEFTAPALVASPGIDLAWEVARQKLLAQREQFKALDSKAQAMIALLTAALGGYIIAAKALYERIGGGIGLLLAIAFVVAAYATSRFADASGIAAFVGYAGFPAVEMKLYFIHALLDAMQANRKELRRRAYLLNSAFVIVAVLGLAVVVVRASGIDHRGL